MACLGYVDPGCGLGIVVAAVDSGGCSGMRGTVDVRAAGAGGAAGAELGRWQVLGGILVAARSGALGCWWVLLVCGA